MRLGEPHRQPGGQKGQPHYLGGEQDAGREQRVAPPAGQVPDPDGGCYCQGGPCRVEIDQPEPPRNSSHQGEIDSTHADHQRVLRLIKEKRYTGGSGGNRGYHQRMQDHQRPDIDRRQPARPGKGKAGQHHGDGYEHNKIPDERPTKD